MPKTKQDFLPEEPPWLVEDWIPLEHRCMDAAPEGSFKTMFGCWLSVCVAAGFSVFGLPVTQGPVLIIDEETPKKSLHYHLERFSRGIGSKLSKLPIYVYCMEGFRFGRKTEMDKIINIIDSIKPIFIRMDSMISMLPGGRQALGENDCHLGEIIRDDLSKILNGRSILVSAHSKKAASKLNLNELVEANMQDVVRGHGSIVGEGCDTGYLIKKVSEHPKPTIFAIVTKIRRQAIPEGNIKYIEMVEETYGQGWARLEEIEMRASPSEMAKKFFPIFKVADRSGSFNHSSGWIYRVYALNTKRECRQAIDELLLNKVIVETNPQNYEINQKRNSQCDTDYLRQLEGP